MSTTTPTSPVRTTKGFLKPQALRDGYVEQAIWRDGPAHSITVHNVTLSWDKEREEYVVKHSRRLEPHGAPSSWTEYFDDLKKARGAFTYQSRH